MSWHTDLIVPREFASSVVLPESTRWWITGGVGSDGIALGETEIYENGIFRFGPDLPKALKEHCMVNLNRTHVFVGGGFGSRSAYLYEFDADVWTDLPDIPVEVRQSLFRKACGKWGEIILHIASS